MVASGKIDFRRVRQKSGRQNVADRPALGCHRQRHCPRRPTLSGQEVGRRRWRLLRVEVVEGPVADVGQLRHDVGQDGAAAAVVAAAARTVIVFCRHHVPAENRDIRYNVLYNC